MLDHANLVPLDEFRQYLVTLARASLDPNTDEPLDSEPREFDHDTEIQLYQEFERFYSQAHALLGTYEYEPGQLGHDFWLTRNGHGAGFWEDEWQPYCNELTELAQSFGECYPYVDSFNHISI